MPSTEIAVFIYLILIGIAHKYAPLSYDWKRCSVTYLSARQYSTHWILLTGNIIFSILVLLDIGLQFLNDANVDWMAKTPIAFFALSILLSSFFPPHPVKGNQIFSDHKDTLHNLFTLLGGMAFLIGILIYFVSVPHMTEKLVHFSFLVVLSVSYLSYGIFTQYSGIVQRVILLITCTWLLFFY